MVPQQRVFDIERAPKALHFLCDFISRKSLIAKMSSYLLLDPLPEDGEQRLHAVLVAGLPIQGLRGAPEVVQGIVERPFVRRLALSGEFDLRTKRAHLDPPNSPPTSERANRRGSGQHERKHNDQHDRGPRQVDQPVALGSDEGRRRRYGLPVSERDHTEMLVVGLVGTERVVVGGTGWTGIGGSATYAGLAAQGNGRRVRILTCSCPSKLRDLVPCVILDQCEPPTFLMQYDEEMNLEHFEYDAQGWADPACLDRLLESLRLIALEPSIDHLHLCPLPSEVYPKALSALRDLQEVRHLEISVQLHFEGVAAARSSLREILSLAQYGFMNEEEAMLLTLTDSCDSALSELATLEDAELTVTSSGRGVFVKPRQSTHWTHQPGRSVRVVDPTGAGDTFAGAYLAASYSGRSPLESAELGQEAARNTITGMSSSALLHGT